MGTREELKLLREIICYNQGKCLAYFNEMGKRHWKMSECLRRLKETESGFSRLKAFFKEFRIYADKNLREAAEHNFEFVNRFFGNRTSILPRICIKANYKDESKDEIVDLFRNSGAVIKDRYSYKENTGFKNCVETGSFYLCNNIPKEAKDKKYRNPRLLKEKIQQLDLNRPTNWINCWRGYKDDPDNVDPKSAYRSTLITPIALKDDYLTQNFRKRLGFDEDSKRTIWGYLCFDHTESNFFDENIDVDFSYIMADILSLYLITRANFTVHSDTYSRVDRLISVLE
jgi:hypothetical protein